MAMSSSGSGSVGIGSAAGRRPGHLRGSFSRGSLQRPDSSAAGDGSKAQIHERIQVSAMAENAARADQRKFLAGQSKLANHVVSKLDQRVHGGIQDLARNLIAMLRRPRHQRIDARENLIGILRDVLDQSAPVAPFQIFKNSIRKFRRRPQTILVAPDSGEGAAADIKSTALIASHGPQPPARSVFPSALRP